MAMGTSNRLQHKFRSGRLVRSNSQAKSTAIVTVIAVPAPANQSVLRIIL